ncbi:MAG: prolyl oligopeptidase family serine peptidase, partial [Candidatus Latescibacteria bacterium]|nr:prolyl oligopeptidase family serine peptidase [bacterium]MBD3425493.1 prolyl oligopeptidase family serine peptidase [Candidatus Latescibacterota bacterium]
MKAVLKVFLALIILCLSGCSDEVQRYSIEQFMNTERVTGGSFSADAKRILFTSDRTGVFNAFSMPVKGGEARQLTESDDNSIFALSYFPEDNRILYLSDQGGNEIYHIYVREENGEARDLTPWENARSLFYGWSYDRNRIIFGSNRRDSRYMDLYTMDIESFEPEIMYVNDAGFNFGSISNDMRYVAFSKARTSSDSDIYLYDRQSGEVELITEHQGNVMNDPSGFSTDSKKLFFLTNQGREFTYLKSYDIETGKAEMVEEADWDISYSYLSREGRYRVTAINRDGSTDIRVRDNSTGERVSLPDLPEGVITSVGISRDEKLMRFYVNGSTSPNNLYIYNLGNGVYRRLTDTMNPEIDRSDLVEAEVVRYESFDGLEIPAIYYRPREASRDNRVPGLIWVHGGPGGQSRIGYNSVIQFLVNHGYAVLAVNNRGSSGYGKKFYRLDDRRHGEDDLADCVEGKKYLIGTGVVNPEKVGIIGGSYGGYMVLAAMAFAPGEFAAGVDIFGVSNWLRTLRKIPDWWEGYREALYEEMGNPETDEEYLRKISPLFHADRIT